jgi:hypothetical protein
VGRGEEGMCGQWGLVGSGSAGSVLARLAGPLSAVLWPEAEAHAEG